MPIVNQVSPSVVDSEEGVLDGSTAPTTPDGSTAPSSLSFSPVLRPRNVDNVEGESAHLSIKSRNDSRSLSSALLDKTARMPPVRNICCVGAGYVGGPTAAVIAFQNPHIRVTVVDKDEKRIRRWNSHHPPIYEPGLNDIVRMARDGSRECVFLNETSKSDASSAVSDVSTASSECDSQCGGHREGLTTIAARQPNLFFTSEVAKCISEADVVLIAVNTPTKYRGAGAGSATDMTAFEAVTAVVAQHARAGAIIVEKSTVPCRTAQLVQETLAQHRPGVHFEVLSNPEFLAAGTAVKDLLNADRILIGSSPTPSGHRAAAALASVYVSWIPRSRIITTNVFSSELAKLVANSMLAQRISSINSIAAVCEATGADVDEVATAIGADPRIGSKFLKAGIGFGGSCFKKDVLSLVYLAETLNLPEVADYWRCVITMNESARNRFASRAVRCLNNTLVGKKITILGYAFKPDTNDTRESPALEIIRTLVEEGPQEIAIFDPCCIPPQTTEEIGRLLGSDVLNSNGGPVVVYADAYEACDASSAVLITTEFDEFRYSAPSTAPDAALSTLIRPKARLTDPRPFERLEPTESDLLALHTYLLQSSPSMTLSSHNSGMDPKDPLSRFSPMPDCSEDCPDCYLEKTTGTTSYGAGEAYISKGRLDWAKISYHMRMPRWVFDGRGVLDVRGMEKLGFRVESVGRQGRA
ncbi:hypothetical protein QBC46DRAFT_99148 [Diplogelasinospora grovesii]|uniref:UDP-glucose 6-dehydrogenase n=1 Tax=Diplogelasinospora grovesii TaxID=303347 RepID=A0AAN6RYI3_9PEZI|nr:hypothetical protein QBC46DRAFT_99148 [Diplogelasinospora grovesii]